MGDITIYGIKNCDTMKKAFAWLEARGVDYRFHDYKKEGVDAAVLRVAIAAHGWENVINRRGTTWRQLQEDVKSAMDENSAVRVGIENPSIIKRPILVKGDQIILGFQDLLYEGADL